MQNTHLLHLGDNFANVYLCYTVRNHACEFNQVVVVLLSIGLVLVVVHLDVVLPDWLHVVVILLGHLGEPVDLQRRNTDENLHCFHNDHFVQFVQRLDRLVEL